MIEFTYEQISEGNKIIAEFMEYPTTLIQYINDTPAIIVYIIDERNYHPIGMKFDSSWDWLMPVVEKIESLGFNTSISGKISKTGIYQDILILEGRTSIVMDLREIDVIKNWENYSKVQIAWLVIVDFIKWYKDQH